MGGVLEARAKRTAALAAFGEALAICRELAEQDPSDAGWQREFAAVLTLALRTVGKSEADRMSVIRSLSIIADAVGNEPALVARFAATIRSNAMLLRYIEQRSTFGRFGELT